ASAVTLHPGGHFNLNSVPLGVFSYTNFNQLDGLFAATGDEGVGVNNAAVYTQMGGSHTVSGVLAIAPGTASATYAMSNAATLTVAAGITVGSGGGSGVLAVSNGASITVSSGTVIHVFASSHLRIDGGTVSAGFVDLDGDLTRLDWQAGTLTMDS